MQLNISNNERKSRGIRITITEETKKDKPKESPAKRLKHTVCNTGNITRQTVGCN